MSKTTKKSLTSKSKGKKPAQADPDLVPLKEAMKPTTKEKADKKLSCLDAAAQVLKAKGEPMNCKAMVEAMAKQNLWTSDAPTPAATLSSAILREMKKGTASRFKKVDRGQFEYQEPKGE